MPSRFFVAIWLFITASIASAGTLQPFGSAPGAPAAPWQPIGLPNQSKPFTRFALVDLDGERVLRIDAERSYGNLVHPLRLDAPPRHLTWRWRLDQPIATADLRQREGDDTALKVCTLWDMPIDNVPFFERQVLRIARSRTGQELPAATVCYVWDATLPAGTELPSPFTGRLRYIVLRGHGEALHRWQHERRDIVADFMKLFGHETHELPPLIGIAVGADADNTRSHSVAHAADVQLEP